MRAVRLRASPAPASLCAVRRRRRAVSLCPCTAAAGCTQHGPANWAAQISERSARTRRQPRRHGGLRPNGSARGGPGSLGGGADLTGLEQQLHHINTQISSLHQPYEDALARCAAISRISRGVDRCNCRAGRSRRSNEVRALAERVDRTRQPAPMAPRSIARTRTLWGAGRAPSSPSAESLAGFEEASARYRTRSTRSLPRPRPQGDPMAFQATRAGRGVICAASSPTSPPTARCAACRRGARARGPVSSVPPPKVSTRRWLKLEARISA